MGIEYDFYISENGRFVVPKFNIDFLFSPSESDIPEISEATENSIKISGRDGDIVLGTNYEPREFKLVVYTDENLTPEEKVREIGKITAFLHSIKNNYEKMAFLQDSKMFEVKYYSQLTTIKFPKAVKFEIPLKSSDAYAMELNKKTIHGIGISSSETVKETGCIITIEGPCQSPTIALNNYQMEYFNSVLPGNKLVIDTGNSTITHITSEGVKTNAAIYYNHEYPKIKYGENEISVLSGVDDASQVTTEWYDLKL